MTWLRNRCLPMAYLALLATLVVVGCTSKEDPSETLTVCGNHSCGELVMVTTDTSSDGYHYLSPRLSPDGDHHRLHVRLVVAAFGPALCGR
jgi:hypothetical protein